ncbi:MAG: hypothetical protein Q9O74_03955 [Planctomycetota bacterium]|nr:hypothetical protein [Planctomycetota bacterium]
MFTPRADTLLMFFGILLCAMAAIPARRNLALCFLRAIGLLALVTLPVGIAQFLWVIEAKEFPELVLGPFAAVPFNMGGLLCAAAFDSVDRAGLMPTRQITMHLGVYLPMVIVQAGILAAVIASRIRTTGRVIADRTILTVLGIVLANSILGITWPWWGS